MPGILVKGKTLGMGFLVAHPQGNDGLDDCQVSGVEKLRSHLVQLLPQGSKGGPAGKDHPHSLLLHGHKNLVRQIGFGVKLDVVAIILGDFAEEEM